MLLVATRLDASRGICVSEGGGMFQTTPIFIFGFKKIREGVNFFLSLVCGGRGTLPQNWYKPS